MNKQSKKLKFRGGKENEKENFNWTCNYISDNWRN